MRMFYGRWPRAKMPERFWMKARKARGCWEWLGSLHPDGYGMFSVKRDGQWRAEKTHRIAWEIAHGRRPPRFGVIMHSCDNPKCVRPGHLRLGTQQENIADMNAKGRRNGLNGGRHRWAKMSDADAQYIKLLRALHGRQDGVVLAISRHVGVSVDAAQKVVSGRAWRHI